MQRDDLHSKFEKRQLAQIAARLRRIKARYGEAVDRITIAANSIIYRGITFKLSDYSLLKALIKEEIKTLQKGILIEITDGIKTSWALSNEENNLLVDMRLAGKIPKARARRILYDPNEGALKEFLKRKEKGLGLSDRVWNTLKPFPAMIETGLTTGINEGKSAAETARELKGALLEPDRLYRRVRDAKGELQLSRAAKEYRPGQGLYRSSFKNAIRLTATENNAAYRTADFERWQALPFVVGIEVHLSNNHPRYDVCDSLQGVYPKDFHFRGWHPQCICYQTPRMATDEEYNAMEDAILGISDDVPEIKQVENLPAGAVKWMEKNAERVKGYKRLPYFITDNKEYLGGFLK